MTVFFLAALPIICKYRHFCLRRLVWYKVKIQVKYITEIKAMFCCNADCCLFPPGICAEFVFTAIVQIAKEFAEA